MWYLKVLASQVAIVAAIAQTAAFNQQDVASVKATAHNVANNLMGFFSLATPGGGLPAPYYWWEAGGLLGGMVEYWHNTGDASYNDVVARGILSQSGPGNDFMVLQAEGNDDQMWFALAAMSAAEYGLPAPPGAVPWLTLAQNVFNEVSGRWDYGRCNGGIKWMIDPKADGWHYKSSIANGLFFQLSARLARFTKDGKYLDWATRSFEWTQSVGLIDKDYNVFDGTDDFKTSGCPDVNHDQWSYNVGVFMYGAAVMQVHTNDPKWSNRVNGLVKAASHFFDGNVMIEVQCEKAATCNVDQQSFKAYLSRWMVGTSLLIPSTQATLMPLISGSANGALRSCTGGLNGQMCGSRWNTNNFDGTTGVGQQMAALDILNGLLIRPASPSVRHPRMARHFIA